MIPAYNSAATLTATIDSVLAAIGTRSSSHFHIEVVDDHSDSDDLASIVSRYAPNIKYFRQPRNVGAVANFNTCIERAEGEFIHILHADDRVLPGFYTSAEDGFSNPEVGFCVCRSDYINSAGDVTVTTRSERPGSGPWPNAGRVLAVSNRVAAPAIAVRARCYKQVGDFDTDLEHSADWHMWYRLASTFSGYFIDEALAQYRVHDEQDTSRLLETGANIIERRECIDTIAAISASTDQYRDSTRRLRRNALLYSSLYAARTAITQGRKRNFAAAKAQMREAWISARSAFEPSE